MSRALLCAAAAALLVLACAPGASAAPRGCDPLDPSACLLPWPNDHFVKRGHLALRDALMPRNGKGVPIRARDYNRSDGFSPGQTIVTRVPRLDLRRSDAVPVTDIGRSFARRAPIVVIDAATGKRQPIWAELDQQVTDPKARALLIHPAANWHEGHRYIVALRSLKDRRGRTLTARRAFRVYRDRLPLRSGATRSARTQRARTQHAGRSARSRAVAQRRPHMERLLRTLRRAGIARRSLYLAWDFTVASRDNLSGRLRSIRDRAFAELGDTNLGDLTVQGGSPAFAIDATSDAGSGVKRIDGHVTVPCFLDQAGCPSGSRFRLDAQGLPVRTPGNVQQARFICLIPPTATSTNPARPLLFGHGLFQSAEAVTQLVPLAALGNFVACATDWAGMSTSDLPNVLALLGDLSRFPTLADRNQQGFLDFMFLGRLMLHPQGLASNPAVGNVIDQHRLFFAGASQGGILGGALTAVAPDFDRSALIVPGMNFSLLLTRSTQFSRFADLLYPAYPKQIERPLITSLLQLLWDRGEANGYAWHITRDPYPNTPRHTVLLHEAFGDHQVSNVATEVEARVLGARLRTPALDPGRSRDRRPFYGIKPIPSLPWGGNALALYDIGPLRTVGGTVFGTPPAPLGDTPPTQGVDPHPLTAFEPPAAAQISEFLKLGGAFVDTCAGKPCHAAGWAGP